MTDHTNAQRPSAVQPPSVDRLIQWLKTQRAKKPDASLKELIGKVTVKPQQLIDLACVDLMQRRREGIAAVVCIGYFHEGVLHVVTTEATELLPPPPAGAVDSVVIAQTRGRNRARGAELRVQVVTTFEVGKTITLYDDLGSILGIEQVLLDPLTGGGEAGFRLRNLDRLPTTVRAVSSGGGEHTVEVEAR